MALSPVQVLLHQPLSAAFRAHIGATLGPEVQYVSLAELRMGGNRQALRWLRSLPRSTTVCVPTEDEFAAAVRPLLIAIAAVSSAGRVISIVPDGRPSAVGLLAQWHALASLAAATALGLAAMARCQRAVRGLRQLPLEATAPDWGANAVLYINANLWFGVKAGGSVGHISGVINAMQDAGLEVELAATNPQAMLREGVRRVQLRFPRRWAVPHEFNLFRFQWQALRQLRALMRGRRFRFLYQRMSVANCAGVELSRQSGIPLVLEYNGSEVWVAKNWGGQLRFEALSTALEDICLRRAHRIVVVSKPLRDELLSRGIAPEKIVTYPNGVDPQYYDPSRFSHEDIAQVRARHGIPAEATVVTFVGTFGQWHGAGVLAQAIRHLLLEQPEWVERHDVRFLLVGDGLKMGEVRGLIGGEQFRARVALPGLIPQAQTIGYLAAADVLASPHVANQDGSAFFGSPTKLFEYMAMGKGIVASDLDQIGEVLHAGIRVWELEDDAPAGWQKPEATALLIRPGVVPDLVRGLRLMVEDPELRRRCGANARRELLNRYTWKHHVAEILKSLTPAAAEGERRYAADIA